VKGYSWTGEQSILDVKCLADQNEGLYITVEQEDELIDALEKTLGCPTLAQAPIR
jgi:Ca-activated chloride channel family protein